jgi:hypothetical protein
VWLTRLALLGCLLFSLGGVASAQAACPPTQASDQIHLSLTTRGDNPLIVDAAIDLAAPAPIYLEYGNPAIGWLRTPTTAAATRHELALVRLVASTSYDVRAFALDSSGTCALTATSVSLTTREVGGLLSGFGTTVTGVPSAPLMLVDLRTPELSGRTASASTRVRWLLILDAAGHLVWYYSVPLEISEPALTAGVNAHIRLADGNFAYLAELFGIEIVSPDARLLRRIPLPDSKIHHELLQVPDGRLMFLSKDERTLDLSASGGAAQTLVRGDEIRLLDLETERVETVWTSFDLITTDERTPQWLNKRDNNYQEWTHGNSLFLGKRGNLLLSMRHLDQIIALSPNFKTVEWRLGGTRSDFSFPSESDRFYGQHSISELPNGNLLMFDNGNGRPEDDYSRALELALDFETKQVHKVWEYRQTPDVFAGSQGSTVRYENGNTLIDFGFLKNIGDPLVVTEVRPNGTPAWEVNLHLGGKRPASSYRARPLQTIAGEQAVQPTAVVGLAGS